MVKQCTMCLVSKSLEDYHNNKNTKDGKTTRCKTCAIEVSCEYVSKNLESVVLKKKERRKDIRKSLFESAQTRARQKGIPFEITLNDIEVPHTCPVLGLTLEKSSGKAKSNSPSLDRIIPEDGYIKGNIQVISYKANAMKSNATVAELFAFAEWIVSNWNKGE